MENTFVRYKNTNEISGQIPRLLIGGVKSFVGNIFVGYTCGVNVLPLQPIHIPEDLLNIIITNLTYETTYK